MFKIGGLGPFEGTLKSTMKPAIYELHFENVRGDNTIFEGDLKIQIFRDDDFDLYGKALAVSLVLTTDRMHVSGKIDLSTD